MWPPLRRWAAARQLRSATASWRDLVEIAAGLPGRDAALILAGVMDAADSIPEVERAAAIEVGLTSASAIVRLAALPALAAFEGPDAAKRRAAADPSEKVRSWAEKLSRADQLALAEEPDAAPGRKARDARQSACRRGDQPTLF